MLSKPRLSARDEAELKKLDTQMEQLPIGETAGEIHQYQALAQSTAKLLAKLEVAKK